MITYILTIWDCTPVKHSGNKSPRKQLSFWDQPYQENTRVLLPELTFFKKTMLINRKSNDCINVMHWKKRIIDYTTMERHAILIKNYQTTKLSSIIWTPFMTCKHQEMTSQQLTAVAIDKPHNQNHTRRLKHNTHKHTQLIHTTVTGIKVGVMCDN